MKIFKRYTIIGIFFVLVTGSLAHFLYGWTNSHKLIGLFAPVNESVWEHMKLLFFPMLAYSIIMIFKFRTKYPCMISSFCFGILAGVFFIPLFYYAYTSVLGKNLFILDISVFLFSIVIAFWLSYKLTLSGRLKPYTLLLCVLVCIFLICFFVFTYNPPDTTLFQDPTVS